MDVLDIRMIDEQTVIKNIINGDVESFRLLVERYQKPVIRMIGGIVHNAHTCEDIAQDVFFTAYKKLKTFNNGQGSFSTWLFTIARNKSINFIRRNKVSFVSEPPESADEENPSANLEQGEFFNELDRQLYSLPHNQKTVFVLAEFEKLPYEQIAQIEGVRIGTVRTRLHRAKRKLAKALRLDWEI
jgi:RNA polymerase sigma-70 factor (ECF subfamily)